MGMAYEVSNSVYDEVMTQLDYREKHGYQRVFEALKLADGRVVHATVYVAGPTNPGFIGAAPLAEMAGQISECVGPSGANRDYLSELAEALRAMGADDPHVFELEEALNRVD
jgi:glutathione-specific gamma-glutamylcyclotransferase